MLVFNPVIINAQELFKDNFLLTGKIAGQNTGRVRLIYPDINGKFIRDTTWLKDGAFSFKGFVSEPTFATIFGNVKSRSVSDSNRTDIFLEPGKMEIELRINDFKNSELIGSKTNVELREFQKFSNEAANKCTNTKDYLNAIYNFIKEHPKSYVSPAQMWPFLSYYTYDSIKTLFRSLDVTVQNSIYGRQFAKELSKADSSNIGSKAKDFSVIDVHGKKIMLSSFKSKFVLLDFWASWCVPCRLENPELRALYQKYSSKGLEVIGITYDEDLVAWKNAIEKDNIDMWYHIPAKIDFKKTRLGKKNESDIAEKFAVPYIPYLILIDKAGIIIGHYGSNNKERLELTNKLKELFGN